MDRDVLLSFTGIETQLRRIAHVLEMCFEVSTPIDHIYNHQDTWVDCHVCGSSLVPRNARRCPVCNVLMSDKEK